MSTPNFAGKYSFVKNENFDAFLEANGVPWMGRKMAAMACPSLEVEQNGDSFSFKLSSRMGVRETNFTLGQDYEEKQTNDVVLKASPSIEGSKLKVEYSPLPQYAESAKPQTHIREVVGDTLTLVSAPWIARKMACATSPELEVTQEGDKMTFKLVSMMQTREISFTIGEEYEEKQHDDTVTKVKPEMKDGKIVLHYSPSEECKDRVKPQTHTREIDGDTLTLTLEIGDLVAKRIFQRVKE